MQFRRRFRAWLLTSGVSLAAPISILSASEPSQVPLTTAHAVHSLPAVEAERGVPVHLRAVLTYYDPYIDPRRGAIFVCDRSGCVFVSVPHRPILPLHAADLVDISGVTGPGDYAPIIEASEVRAVGKAALPTPRMVTGDDLFTGAHDCDWIEVQGSVRSVHSDANDVALEILSNGRSFPATSVRQPNVNYDSLVDAQVRVIANTSPVFNSRRQMVGAHVFFPSLRLIRVLRAAPSDPFTLPETPLSDLFRISTSREMAHRVHMEGTLTLDWPGRMICVQSGEEGLCAETRQKTDVAVGTPVEVVGFPAIRSFRATLEDAIFRVTAAKSLAIPPAQISSNQAIGDSLDGRVVELDAELIGQDFAATEPTLMLRADGVLIPAIVPRDSLAGLGRPWKDGSLVRVTGICNLQVDALSISLGNGMVQPESARLLLRSAGDIVVLKAPSWWTAEHALTGFAVGGAIIFFAFAWIVILRHIVKQRTHALRQSEERLRYLSEHDALTGLPNRILLYHRLQMALEAADRGASHFALLMADVDGFKAINDELGHQAGDRLLCELAQRLSDCVRLTDTVARIGGDEFVVLLPDLHVPAEAELIAAKILAAVSSPLTIDERVAAITVSIGLVTYPEGGLDAQTLMEHADEAMYAAKNEGKNGFRLFGPERESQEHFSQRHSPYPPVIPLPAN